MGHRIALLLGVACVFMCEPVRAAPSDEPAADESPDASPGESPETSPQESQAPERPWAKSVDPVDQKRALELFKQGNELYLKKSYGQARDIYLDALKHWRHPSIQYNLSECFVYLDRPREALEYLEESLRFGEAALGGDLYQRGLTRKKLLEDQLAVVQISSTEVGTRVSLDGEELFIAPGKKRVRVTPGKHQLLAEKPGFVTLSEQILALPREPVIRDITLVPIVDQQIRLVRRWPTWMPWTVMGSGLAITATGTALILQANDSIRDADGEISDRCSEGCPSSDVDKLLDRIDSAELRRTIGVSAAIAGGAGIAAGVALVLLNQPDEIDSSISVTPTRGGAGVWWTGRF